MKRRSKKPRKLFRLGVYTVDDPDDIRLFGPWFTDSADDMDTLQQVVSGFNEDAAYDAGAWCIAAFPVEPETVSS
jgi:hypothetical protein